MTSCRPIRSVIIRVKTKSDNRGSPICLSRVCLQVELGEVLLPIKASLKLTTVKTYFLVAKWWAKKQALFQSKKQQCMKLVSVVDMALEMEQQSSGYRLVFCRLLSLECHDILIVKTVPRNGIEPSCSSSIVKDKLGSTLLSTWRKPVASSVLGIVTKMSLTYLRWHSGKMTAHARIFLRVSSRAIACSARMGARGRERSTFFSEF